jgi:medium-chain acyl-[acyl-carrier-protein] hydrolase
MGEQLCTESEEMIEQMADGLSQHLDKPYAIFGHSMGALLAFELAQRLQATALRRPSYLFLSGRMAAQLPWKLRLHELPDDEFIAELEKRYGGLPQQILQDPQLLEIYLPILRADLTLLGKYRYSKKLPLSCPILATAGKQDSNVSNEALLAWREHTSGEFQTEWLEGGHFYLAGESRKPLLELLSKKLAGLNVTSVDDVANCIV